MTLELLVGSGNEGKRRELAERLTDLPLRVRSLAELGSRPDTPAEDGDSFESNARSKALGYASSTGLWTLADDSGLCVEALGGDPGVRSARFSGPAATDSENNRLLLSRLEALGEPARRAKFVCALCLATPDGDLLIEERGEVEGHLASERRGAGGFGYDPLFIPAGANRTFAELPPAYKRKHSHRARALDAFAKAFRDLLAERGV